MKRALISTLFNEADNVSEWWECLQRQTVLPDEIVIVDGGSKDGTWEKLQSLARASRVPVKLEQRRCNIAAGRNRAIGLTDADIIAATDAGSFPETEWFGALTQPLLAEAKISLVGGRCENLVKNEFQRRLTRYTDLGRNVTSKTLVPSSRNVAFRRAAWWAVGGYPEWLTLTGEDALFNENLRQAGFVFHYEPSAVVHWAGRPDLKSYLKMMYSYGYGSGEAGLSTRQYGRCWLTTLLPPLILFSRNPLRDAPLRYVRNAATAGGWLAGWLGGHRPPPGWFEHRGVFLSPETQRYLSSTAKIVATV